MLVLSRKQQQQIKIGEEITVTILRVSGSTVRVGIQAPREVRVVRGELPKADSSQAEPAATAATQESAVEIGALEIGAIELVAGNDEPSESLDEAAAEPGSERHQSVVMRAPLALSQRSSTFRNSRGPLAHLVAGSVALAK